MFGRFFKKKLQPPAAQHSVDWTASPEGRRKLRTESVLKSRGIPVNPWLPAFAEEAVTPRSGPQVRARMLCIVRVAVAAARGESDEATGQIKAICPSSELTQDERDFLATASPTDHQRAHFAWRYECAWALQWALGLVAEIGDCAVNCDSVEVRRIAKAAAAGPLPPPVDKATLLDMGDTLYRMHWACVDARINSKEPPSGLEPGVVWERRRAIQWLLEPEVEWDDISLDT